MRCRRGEGRRRERDGKERWPNGDGGGGPGDGYRARVCRAAVVEGARGSGGAVAGAARGVGAARGARGAVRAPAARGPDPGGRAGAVRVAWAGADATSGGEV